MIEVFLAAGWPAYPLLLASVVALAISLERFAVLRPSKIVPQGLAEQALARLRSRDDAKAFLATLDGMPSGRVLSAILRSRGKGAEAQREAAENAGRQVVHELNKRVGALGVIASIAPLMGLFGTVVGMIEIFGSGGTGQNPQVLAHGISVALYNTAFGLVVAVPSLIVHKVLRARIERITLDMEHEAHAFMESLGVRAGGQQ